SRSGKPITPEEWPHIRSIARWVLPVLVGPRIARTGASERGAICFNVAAIGRGARFLRRDDFRTVLTLIRHHRVGVEVTKPRASAAALSPPCLAPAGLEERRRACLAVQHSRLGIVSAAR